MEHTADDFDTQPPFNQSQFEQQIVDQVNAHRVSIGLNALTVNPAIARECRTHSTNMASGTVAFGHDGFSERIATLKKEITPYSGASENVAYIWNVNASEMVTNWLNSPGHKENIESEAAQTGVGCAMGNDGKIYGTQIFW